MQDRAGFATNGCTLAFGLGHSYPKTTDVGSDVGVEGAFWRHFEHRLKGTDAVLLQAVKQCKLDFTFKAAFFRNMDSFDDPDDEVRIFAELRSLISDRLRGLDQATFTSLYDQLEEQLSTLRVRNGLRKYQASQGAFSVTIAQLILDRSCLWTTRIKWKGDGTTTLVI